MIVIDEATQATEPATLVPLTQVSHQPQSILRMCSTPGVLLLPPWLVPALQKYETSLCACVCPQGARCVVMAGDPAQLPPTVTSQEAAQEHGLRVTLFERLALSLGLEPLLLDTQYRMNPAISAFPRYTSNAGFGARSRVGHVCMLCAKFAEHCATDSAGCCLIAKM